LLSEKSVVEPSDMGKYQNLRNKTVFDFCDDKVLLEEITECTTVEEHLEMIRIATYDERARAFSELARITKNKSLESAVNIEFAKELESYDAFFDE
jgi:hypothetical protein